MLSVLSCGHLDGAHLVLAAAALAPPAVKQTILLGTVPAPMGALPQAGSSQPPLPLLCWWHMARVHGASFPGCLLDRFARGCLPSLCQPLFCLLASGKRLLLRGVLLLLLHRACPLWQTGPAGGLHGCPAPRQDPGQAPLLAQPLAPLLPQEQEG